MPITIWLVTGVQSVTEDVIEGPEGSLGMV
jgi:hypothetical protein